MTILIHPSALERYIDTATALGAKIDSVYKFEFDTVQPRHNFKRIYFKKEMGYILIETFDGEKLEALYL